MGTGECEHVDKLWQIIEPSFLSCAVVLCAMWLRHQTEGTTLREGLQVGGAGCGEAKGVHQRRLLHRPQGTQARAAQVQEGVQDQLPLEFVELDGLLQGLLR